MIPAKRKHQCGPRVKTGCLTCRVRRIKCDETRPACERCTISRRECDGYLHLIDDFAVTASPSDSFDQIESYEIPFPIPGSQRERQLFHYYCTSGAKDLSGDLDTALWYDLVLTHSEHTPTIRQAVIAFSATQIQLVNGRDQILLDETNEHLKQYNKAVCYLRKYLATAARLNTKVVLITCALLFATCTARGEMEEAYQHIESGLLILRVATQVSKEKLGSVLSHHAPSPTVKSACPGDHDADTVPSELRNFFMHVEKELLAHEMTQGLSRVPVPVPGLVAGSSRQCPGEIKAAMRLTTTRLLRLLHPSDTAAATEHSCPLPSATLLDHKNSTMLQLVKRWSHTVSSMSSNTYDSHHDIKLKKELEMARTSKKRLSILSLNIWLAILRIAFPQSIHLWTMCPNPLIEAFIVLRERITLYVLSWISTSSDNVAEGGTLQNSIELSVVVPLTLLARELAQENVYGKFPRSVDEMLYTMLAHRFYDAEKVAAICHHLAVWSNCAIHLTQNDA